jgi:hypothetical protein
VAVVQGLGLAAQMVQVVVLRPGLVRSHTATMGVRSLSLKVRQEWRALGGSVTTHRERS